MMGAFRSGVLVMASVLVSTVLAGPKIEFDTKNFKCGEVIEGQADKIDAVFNIRNTGNAVLTIKNVRPGCGCTVVKYDTTIKPGKTAKIEASVNIKGYRPGSISKPVTVTSNATNDSVVRLNIEATIVAEIEVSESFLTLGGDDTAATRTIGLASKMEDLKVSEVFFRSGENSGSNVQEWKNDLPLLFKFTWTPADTVRPDGYKKFNLKISVPEFKAEENGTLIIKTSHPGKPEISIRTHIVPTAGTRK
jgi:hypothetical protein